MKARRNHFAIRAMQNFSKEVADVEDFNIESDGDSSSLQAELIRANALLDKRYDKIALDILSSLTSKGACEKAADSYDIDYWLNLPISYGKIVELMQEAALILKRYKTNIPDSWVKFASLDLDSIYNYQDPIMSKERTRVESL